MGRRMGQEAVTAPMSGEEKPEPTTDSQGRPFVPLATVAKHATNEDIWMAINGKVYNVTKYMEEHPGGEEVLMDKAGQDATEEFEDVGHSNDARKTLETFIVGSAMLMYLLPLILA